MRRYFEPDYRFSLKDADIPEVCRVCNLTAWQGQVEVKRATGSAVSFGDRTAPQSEEFPFSSDNNALPVDGISGLDIGFVFQDPLFADCAVSADFVSIIMNVIFPFEEDGRLDGLPC